MNIKRVKMNMLKVGDIIWAKRYSSKTEEKRIPEGHKEGPFVIIKKTDKRMYALSITSKEWVGYKFLKVKISPVFGKNNKLDRNSFVFVGKTYLVKEDNYIFKIGKVSSTDLNIIKKQLYLVEQTPYNEKIKSVKIKSKEFNLSKGDIIEYNKELLYVRCVRIDNIYCNHLSLSNSDDSMEINGIKYNIDYKNKRIINKKYNYNFVNVVNSETREYITENIKTIQIPDVGRLVKYNKNIYYIFKEKNISFQAIRIYELDADCKEEIRIKNKPYYTDFEIFDISIYDSVEVLRVADEKEIIKIFNRIRINTEEPKRGFVVEFNNELYYIYSEQNNNFITYKLYTGIASKGMVHIILNDKGYFTKFELYTMSKREMLRSILVADDNEIKMFRETVKQHKKNVHEIKDYDVPTVNHFRKYYSIKSVVLDNETLEKYVVVYNTELYIKLINLSDSNDCLNLDLREIDEMRYEVISEIDNVTWRNMKLLDILKKNR